MFSSALCMFDFTSTGVSEKFESGHVFWNPKRVACCSNNGIKRFLISSHLGLMADPEPGTVISRGTFKDCRCRTFIFHGLHVQADNFSEEEFKSRELLTPEDIARSVDGRNHLSSDFDRQHGRIRAVEQRSSVYERYWKQTNNEQDDVQNRTIDDIDFSCHEVTIGAKGQHEPSERLLEADPR